MYIVFDNLSATIIGSIVLLMVFAMQQRIRNVSIDQVMSYAANDHVIEFGTWMQEDMVNIGWQVASGNGIVSAQQNDSIPNLTKWFEFDGLDASDPTVATRIQYQLIPALDGGGAQTHINVDGTDVPLWQVRRLVNGDVTGQSAPLVTQFRIETLNTAGQAVTPTAARQLRIKLSMGMPFGDDSFLRETHWVTSFFIVPE